MPFGFNADTDFVDIPDESNPGELLKRIKRLEGQLEHESARSKELEAGITRMAAYQGVLHILQDTGPK